MGFFSSAKDWLSDAASSVSHAVTHPGETFNAAKEATSEFIGEVAENPGRFAALAGQGLVNGTCGAVSWVGDLGVMAYNGGTALTNRVAGTDFQGTEFSFQDTLEEGFYDMTGIERLVPETDAERAVLYGTQAITEVGIFVGATIATGGLAAGAAGAAGTARAASLGTRAVSALGAGTRIGTKTGVALTGVTTTSSAIAANSDFQQNRAEQEFVQQQAIDAINASLAEDFAAADVAPTDAAIDEETRLSTDVTRPEDAGQLGATFLASADPHQVPESLRNFAQTFNDSAAPQSGEVQPVATTQFGLQLT